MAYERLTDRQRNRHHHRGRHARGGEPSDPHCRWGWWRATATGNSYTVVLTSQPAGDVTVTVSGHAGTDLTLAAWTPTGS